MLKNKKYGGFTLLEMLVVVLIIGILAGIALPQYRKSVLKTKLAQLYIAISTAKKNVQLYLDANGYPPDGERVYFTGEDSIADIEMPGDCSTGVTCRSDLGTFQVFCLGERNSTGCSIIFEGNEKIDGIYVDLYMLESNKFWFASEFYADTDYSAKFICQWLNERKYYNEYGEPFSCLS